MSPRGGGAGRGRSPCVPPGCGGGAHLQAGSPRPASRLARPGPARPGPEELWPPQPGPRVGWEPRPRREPRPGEHPAVACGPKSNSWEQPFGSNARVPKRPRPPPDRTAAPTPRALTPFREDPRGTPGLRTRPRQARGAGPGARGRKLPGGTCSRCRWADHRATTGQRFSFGGLQGRSRLRSKLAATYLLCLIALGLSFPHL